MKVFDKSLIPLAKIAKKSNKKQLENLVFHNDTVRVTNSIVLIEKDFSTNAKMSDMVYKNREDKILDDEYDEKIKINYNDILNVKFQKLKAGKSLSVSGKACLCNNNEKNITIKTSDGERDVNIICEKQTEDFPDVDKFLQKPTDYTKVVFTVEHLRDLLSCFDKNERVSFFVEEDSNHLYVEGDSIKGAISLVGIKR